MCEISFVFTGGGLLINVYFGGQNKNGVFSWCDNPLGPKFYNWFPDFPYFLRENVHNLGLKIKSQKAARFYFI